MAPKRWASAPQYALLKASFDDYEKARGKNRIVKFWPKVNAQFLDAFPERDDLYSKGLISSKEGTLTEAEQQLLAKAVGKRQEQIKNWFRAESARTRHKSANKSDTGLQSLFHARAKRRRRHQATEMFEKVHRDRVKSAVAEALVKELEDRGAANQDRDSGSSEELSDSDSDDSEVSSQNSANEGPRKTKRKSAGTLSRSERMRVKRRVVAGLWEEASEDVRANVLKELEEENILFAKRGLDDPDESAERTPDQYDAAISEVVEVLSSVFKVIEQNTGWLVTAIIGGPDPRAGGDIAVDTVSYGRTEANNTFAASHADFDNAVIKPYGKWLKRMFPVEVRKARALVYDAPDTDVLEDLIPMVESENPASDSPPDEERPKKKPTKKAPKKKTTAAAATVPREATPALLTSAEKPPHTPQRQTRSALHLGGPSTSPSQPIEEAFANWAVDPALLEQDFVRKTNSVRPRALNPHMVLPSRSADGLGVLGVAGISTAVRAQSPFTVPLLTTAVGGFNFPFFPAAHPSTSPSTPSPDSSSSSTSANASLSTPRSITSPRSTPATILSPDSFASASANASLSTPSSITSPRSTLSPILSPDSSTSASASLSTPSSMPSPFSTRAPTSPALIPSPDSSSLSASAKTSPSTPSSSASRSLKLPPAFPSAGNAATASVLASTTPRLDKETVPQGTTSPAIVGSDSAGDATAAKESNNNPPQAASIDRPILNATARANTPVPFQSRPATKPPNVTNTKTQGAGSRGGKGGRGRGAGHARGTARGRGGAGGIDRAAGVRDDNVGQENIHPGGNGKKRKAGGADDEHGGKRTRSDGSSADVQVQTMSVTSTNATFLKTVKGAAKMKAGVKKADLANRAGDHPLVVFPAPADGFTASRSGRQRVAARLADGSAAVLPHKGTRARKA